MERGEGGFRDFHVNASTRVQLFGGQLEGGWDWTLTILSSPDLSPISAIRGWERGWFRSTMGRIRLRHTCNSIECNWRCIRRAKGEKKERRRTPPISFVTPSPLAPFMNILGILTRFPTTTISPFTNSGQPRASSSSRTPVVLVVDDDVSASLGTPTERASNSPNRRPNIKRDVNESREKSLVSPPVTDFHAIYFTIVQY